MIVKKDLWLLSLSKKEKSNHFYCMFYISFIEFARSLQFLALPVQVWIFQAFLTTS